MKKRILKLIALSLVVLTAFSVVGCGGCDWSVLDPLFEIQPDVPSGSYPKESVTGMEMPTSRDTNYWPTPNLPTDELRLGELDFEGAKLVILLPDDNDISREFYADSPVSEIDEAVAMTEHAVKEVLDIDVKYERVPIDRSNRSQHSAILYDMIAKDFASDLHSYDISINYAYATVGLAQRGYAANLLDNETFPYFDFDLKTPSYSYSTKREDWDKDYFWNQDFLEIATVGDELNGKRMYYTLAGGNLSYYNSAVVTWYNKRLYDESRDGLDYERLHDMAIEGFWTYEELYRMVTASYGESQGAKTLMISEDSARQFKESLLYSWNAPIVVKENTNYSFDISSNEKAETILTKTRDLLAAESVAYGNEMNFAEGEALFFIDRFDANYDENKAIREMHDKGDLWGLLPLPKYDVDDEYRTYVGDEYNLVSVINYGAGKDIKGEAASAWLQLLAEEALITIRGYYINRVVRAKFFGQDDSQGTVTESIEMADIIMNNIVLDRESVLSDQLGGINSLWCDAVDDEEGRTLEQIYKERREQLDEALKSFNDFYK